MTENKLRMVPTAAAGLVRESDLGFASSVDGADQLGPAFQRRHRLVKAERDWGAWPH
jgi:hypothetical protein